MRRVFDFFIGASLGGLVGAVLALLFAPAPGKVVRTEISNHVEAFANDIRQAASTKRIELQERLDTLRTPKT